MKSSALGAGTPLIAPPGAKGLLRRPARKGYDTIMPYAIDRKITEIIVGPTEVLTGLLGGRVGRDRMVRRVAFAKDFSAAFPINRGTGCRDEFGQAVLLDEFQHSDESANVDVDRQSGIGDRRADTRASREVDDPFDLPGSSGCVEAACEIVGLADVALDQCVGRVLQRRCNVCSFDARVIEIVKIVEYDDFFPPSQEFVAQV